MQPHVNRGRGLFLAMMAALVAAALVVAGCGSSSSDDGSKTLGASMLNMRDPDLAHMNRAMQEQARADGVELVTVDARGDVATELSQIEDLVTRKPDAIVMMPIDGESSQTAAKRVNEAGIPLFILSTAFPEDTSVEYEAYIGVDDTEAGRMQADYVNEQLPEGGRIIYLVGTYGASWTDRRKTGFMERKNPNIDIATELQANGSRDEAKRIMEDLLSKYPDRGQIAGVVAHNDEMAIGAASAIRDAGRQDEFRFVVGVDGTEPGLDAIRSGEMTATVLQRSADQGRKAVDVMTAFLDGREVERVNNLPFTLVTSDNVSEFAR
jgi:inositol transport system substrate-binding protein